MIKKFYTFFILLIVFIFCFNGNSINLNNTNYKLELKNNYLYIENTKLLNQQIIDFKVYDLDKDLDDEIIVLTLNKDIYGKDIILYDITANNLDFNVKEIYKQDFEKAKPWKIDICNLDNDDDIDIFIGVYKATKYYKDIRNRPFFYSWNGKSLYKKWTGSFFTELDLIDISFGYYMGTAWQQVAVLEKNKDNLYRVGLYNWTGFGFQKIAESEYYNNIKNIATKQIQSKDYINLKTDLEDITLSKTDKKIYDYIKLMPLSLP